VVIAAEGEIVDSELSQSTTKASKVQLFNLAIV
jgi:hypothetical protein